jgi:hypothetical protein
MGVCKIHLSRDLCQVNRLRIPLVGESSKKAGPSTVKGRISFLKKSHRLEKRFPIGARRGGLRGTAETFK